MKRRNFSGQTTRLVNMIRTISLSTVLATSFVSTAFAETVSATQTAHYDITANDLGAALAIFAAQSGVVLSFDTDLTKGLKSTDLKGEYSIVQGFEQLLKGTNLQLIQRNDGSLTLQKIQAKPQPVQARDMGQLKAIDVAVSASRRAVTNDANVAQLPVITVNAEQNGSAEDGYLVKNITGVGIWGERSLQDTPYSMNIVSGELIENIVGNTDQIFKMNPVVNLGASQDNSLSWGTPLIKIRGFSSETNYIIDGISMGYTQYTMIDEIERIEVLSGLSGFLYGLSSQVGGTVNYVLKRPTYERLTNLTVGNYGNQQWFGHLDLGNKIDADGRFAYRLNISHQNGESIIRNQNIEKTLFSGALDWNLTDNLLLQFDASYRENNIDRPSDYISSSKEANIFNIKNGYTPDWGFNYGEQSKLGLKLKWLINDKLSFRAGYTYLDTKDDASLPLVYDNNNETYRFNYYRMYPRNIKKHGAYLYSNINFNTLNINHKLTLGLMGLKDKTYLTQGAWEWVNLGNYILNDIYNIGEPNYRASVKIRNTFHLKMKN